MAATDTNTLFSEGRCYECYGETSQTQILRLAILARILTASNPVAATDPQSLLSYGRCFGCIGMSAADIMELALLDQISASGTGGGGSGASNMSGNGGPTGVVIPNAVGVLYFDDAAPPTTYRATGATSADWLQII